MIFSSRRQAEKDKVKAALDKAVDDYANAVSRTVYLVEAIRWQNETLVDMWNLLRAIAEKTGVTSADFKKYSDERGDQRKDGNDQRGNADAG